MTQQPQTALALVVVAVGLLAATRALRGGLVHASVELRVSLCLVVLLGSTLVSASVTTWLLVIARRRAVDRVRANVTSKAREAADIRLTPQREAVSAEAEALIRDGAHRLGFDGPRTGMMPVASSTSRFRRGPPSTSVYFGALDRAARAEPVQAGASRRALVLSGFP